MSFMSNNPKDYYFYVASHALAKDTNISVIRVLVIEKKQWDSEHHPSGDGINFALMKQIESAMGVKVAECVEEVLEIWLEHGEINLLQTVKGLQQMGFSLNHEMDEKSKEFADYIDELG